MRNRLRNLALALVLGTLRITLRFLSLVVPQTKSVVVANFPETEGNGLEAARALVRRYDGTVVWLRRGGEVPADVQALADQGMVLVPMASLAGLRAYLRASAVLFTHGLYGSPQPCRRKPIVNLWHGDGPKDIRPGKSVGARIASTYVVGNTELYTHFKATAFGVPSDHELVTGNPRTDQLWRHPSPAELARLGITGSFVVWMPTFRQVRAVGAVRVHDTAAPVEDAHAELGPLLEGLRARGLQLVVKPHPLDLDRRQLPGMVTVDDDDLAAAGVSLYALLGVSSGLVTDYSSVWVDYLLVDRPIAFSVPDRASYDRELYPADVLDWVPGEVVDPASRPFASFFADLDAAGLLGATARRDVAKRIGLNASPSAADDLVTALVKLGVLASG